MRTISKLVLTLVLSCPATAYASPPTEISISVGSPQPTTTGQALMGSTKSYSLKLAAGKAVTFQVDATESNCKVDFNKASHRGVMTSSATFPTTYSDVSQIGEIYTVSFYQSRIALLGNLPCDFEFSAH